MESEPMPSSLTVLTSPGYRISDDVNAHDNTAFTSLSAANIQLMTVFNVAACGLKVKISDFGISRDLESTLAKATIFTDTLLYMAPERISGGMYSYPSISGLSG
ncbi:unnamed protein product [Peronospora destructor]|uniref:Protein kinase domain-containing protein n=1 Tax=Peronospora destructor TaxID=86335 RepID=A0AAV0TB38_9STRA|nr:unnamed protein product [Peronospora destructor]